MMYYKKENIYWYNPSPKVYIFSLMFNEVYMLKNEPTPSRTEPIFLVDDNYDGGMMSFTKDFNDILFLKQFQKVI